MGVSDHRRLACLLNRLFRRRSKKTSKLRVILYKGNPPLTGLMRFMRVTKLLVLLSQDDVIINIFRVTGPLRGEFTGKIPLTKASDAELRCFFICAWTNGWAKHQDTGDLMCWTVIEWTLKHIVYYISVRILHTKCSQSQRISSIRDTVCLLCTRQCSFHIFSLLYTRLRFDFECHRIVTCKQLHYFEFRSTV